MALSKITNDGVAASGLPADSVVQVVTATTETEVDLTSSTSLADTGESISITPTSSSNKVLIRMAVHFICSGNASGGRFGIYRSIDGGSDTEIEVQKIDYANYFRPGGTGTMQFRNYSIIEFLDSPATTSSIEYKLYGDQHSGSFRINNGGTTYFSATEVAQ